MYYNKNMNKYTNKYIYINNNNYLHNSNNKSILWKTKKKRKKMKIPKNAIVSNSDIIKNYKTQRERAEIIGKLFVFKNNQPDAVLFSMSEFEKVAELLELVETLSEAEINNILEMVKDHKKKISIAL